MQLMHRIVQKWTSTTLPRRDAIVSGSLLIQSVMPASAGACPRFSRATLAGSVVEIGAGRSGSMGEAAIGWVVVSPRRRSEQRRGDPEESPGSPLVLCPVSAAAGGRPAVEALVAAAVADHDRAAVGAAGGVGLDGERDLHAATQR